MSIYPPMEVVNEFFFFFLDTHILLYQIVFISVHECLHFYTSDSLRYTIAREWTSDCVELSCWLG